MVRFFAMFMCLLLSALSMGSVAAFADHPPEKLFRNFKAFGQFGETGQLGLSHQARTVISPAFSMTSSIWHPL